MRELSVCRQAILLSSSPPHTHTHNEATLIDSTEIKSAGCVCMINSPRPVLLKLIFLDFCPSLFLALGHETGCFAFTCMLFDVFVDCCLASLSCPHLRTCSDGAGSNSRKSNPSERRSTRETRQFENDEQLQSAVFSLRAFHLLNFLVSCPSFDSIRISRPSLTYHLCSYQII